MGHDHHHHHDQGGYYVEQLCTIGISAALGVIAVLLWRRGQLFFLADKFHLPVLLGGIALLVLAVIRSVALWAAVGRVAHDHEHEHNHDHAHAHDHDHAGACDHDHDHEHPPGHAGHAHDHDHDHDHGWNPLRYVFLMLPVVFFFLNLPNEGFSGAIKWVDFDAFDQGSSKDKGGDVIDLDFKEFQDITYDAERRTYYDGRHIRLKGQYAPSGNDKLFTLIRFKLSCCAADAIPLPVVIRAPEPIRNIKHRDWVEVTGRLTFAKHRDREEYVPVLQLASKADIRPVPAPSNPFLQ